MIIRQYAGRPVLLAIENSLASYVDCQSRGNYDVGRGGLTIKVVDSNPYYAAVIYQNRLPIAVVDGLAGSTGLVQALATDTPEKLRAAFEINV